MDRGAWQATVHGVTKSWTQLSDYAQHSTYILYHHFLLKFLIIILIQLPLVVIPFLLLLLRTLWYAFCSPGAYILLGDKGS